MGRVFVAMSGGVDSSLAAALLVEDGRDVVGVSMRLLDEDARGRCCSADASEGARLVCDMLGIPHHTWDVRETFEREVVRDFVDEYAAGRTPNPCVRCNDRVKTTALLARVLEAGGDCLATGHYARIVETPAGRRVGRAADPDKDQSYFLYRCTEEQLSRMLFPVGDMRKQDVRARALELGLPTARAEESQDACFLGGGDTRAFIRQRHPSAFRSGDVVDSAGAAVGRHDGVAGLTVGQRYRSGGSSGARRYILTIDPDRARVVVGSRRELDVRTVRATCPVWHGGQERVRVTARVRYRGAETRATARAVDDGLMVEFDEPVAAAAPGQAVVCWDGSIVIGGGVIEGAA